MKAYKYLTCLALASLSLSACTDLDETVYSEVSSNNYFQQYKRGRRQWHSALSSTDTGP